jgi:hypothetical protein
MFGKSDSSRCMTVYPHEYWVREKNRKFFFSFSFFSPVGCEALASHVAAISIGRASTESAHRV